MVQQHAAAARIVQLQHSVMATIYSSCDITFKGSQEQQHHHHSATTTPFSKVKKEKNCHERHSRPTVAAAAVETAAATTTTSAPDGRITPSSFANSGSPAQRYTDLELPSMWTHRRLKALAVQRSVLHCETRSKHDAACKS